MKISFAIATIVALALPAVHVAKADAVDDSGEKIVKLLEQVGDDVAANKPDCDKIGDALLKHVDADAAVISEAKKLDEGKSKEEKQALSDRLQKKFGTRMAAAMKKGEAMRACRTNAKVKQWSTKVGF